MPQFNRRELDVSAREYGFNRDTFEKVLRLGERVHSFAYEADSSGNGIYGKVYSKGI